MVEQKSKQTRAVGKITDKVHPTVFIEISMKKGIGCTLSVIFPTALVYFFAPPSLLTLVICNCFLYLYSNRLLVLSPQIVVANSYTQSFALWASSGVKWHKCKTNKN